VSNFDSETPENVDEVCTKLPLLELESSEPVEADFQLDESQLSDDELSSEPVLPESLLPRELSSEPVLSELEEEEEEVQSVSNFDSETPENVDEVCTKLPLELELDSELEEADFQLDVSQLFELEELSSEPVLPDSEELSSEPVLPDS